MIERFGQPVTLGQMFINNARYFADDPALEFHGGTRTHAAVIGRPDLTWGETACACVVPAPGTPASKEELIEHCRTPIASYKKPRDLLFIDEIPKLVSGKVDKKFLRDLHGKA